MNIGVIEVGDWHAHMYIEALKKRLEENKDEDSDLKSSLALA